MSKQQRKKNAVYYSSCDEALHAALHTCGGGQDNSHNVCLQNMGIYTAEHRQGLYCKHVSECIPSGGGQSKVICTTSAGGTTRETVNGMYMSGVPSRIVKE